MQFKGPLQLTAGDADGHCPAADLKLLAEKVGGRAQVRIVQRAEYFLGGRETELTAAIGEMSAMI
ncbi:MAG TPA: hypothetical protein VMF50_01160 [Candidatus Binataceae bacterium]|nr:hypothetical protein [Candidatus Binataceae bacterium]